MKHYFYLIRDLSKFSKDSVVYSVSVGSSIVEQSKCELLKLFCQDAGWYFHPVSDDSDRAISLLADSVFGKSVYSCLALRRQALSINEAYKRTIDDYWADIEKSPVVTKSFFHHLACFGKKFHANYPKIHSSKTARSVSRNYLKPSKEEEFVSAMIGFGLILALFLIAGRLEFLYG